MDIKVSVQFVTLVPVPCHCAVLRDARDGKAFKKRRGKRALICKQVRIPGNPETRCNQCLTPQLANNYLCAKTRVVGVPFPVSGLWVLPLAYLNCLNQNQVRVVSFAYSKWYNLTKYSPAFRLKIKRTRMMLEKNIWEGSGQYKMVGDEREIIAGTG